MKKFLYGLMLSGVFGLAAAPFMPGTATATSTSPSASASWAPTYKECVTDKGWYVNDDENDRKPTATAAGLKFEGNDLIHHGAAGTLENVGAGSFTASPAPDQPSFFSVEVRNDDGSGYATLRWNTTTSKWNMVTGGQFYENTSASSLVLMTNPAKSNKLLSFGVGYTNSPPGTVATTVSKVTFKGIDYPLTCMPPVQPTPSASSKSPSASASTGVYYATCADAPHKLIKGVDAGYRPGLDSDGDGTACEERGDAQSSLPVTGSKTWLLVGGGVILVLAGIVLTFVGTRKIRATQRPNGHFHT